MSLFNLADLFSPRIWSSCLYNVVHGQFVTFSYRYIDSQNADGSYTYGFEVTFESFSLKKCFKINQFKELPLELFIKISQVKEQTQGADGTYKIETRLANGQVSWVPMIEVVLTQITMSQISL